MCFSEQFRTEVDKIMVVNCQSQCAFIFAIECEQFNQLCTDMCRDLRCILERRDGICSDDAAARFVDPAIEGVETILGVVNSIGDQCIHACLLSVLLLEVQHRPLGGKLPIETGDLGQTRVARIDSQGLIQIVFCTIKNRNIHAIALNQQQ